MIKAIRARLFQGYRTMRYPAGDPPPLPAKFRGLPAIDGARCLNSSGEGGGCEACAEVCPTAAVDLFAAVAAGPEHLAGVGGPARPGRPRIDLGACIFCGACEAACPSGAIAFGRDHRLAVSRREALLLGPGAELERAEAMGRELRRLLGRALRLREVSAGGCNACEADVNVLGTVGWDLGRFGIQFVASPRHADGILVTGPVTRNMELALRKTWEAVPGPKVAIAVGACAIAGGPWRGGPEVLGGLGETGIPVDLWVPGCPPHPLTVLDGLLRLVGRLKD